MYSKTQVEEAVVGAAALERQNVRMLEAGGGADLHHEALDAEDGGEFALQDLEGDLAIVLLIVGEIHGGHAAGAEGALEAVVAGKGGGEAGGGVKGRRRAWRELGRCECSRPLQGRRADDANERFAPRPA